MCAVRNFFLNAKPHIIGMIHVRALPGTPKADSHINLIVDQVCKEAEIYRKCNIDSVLIENMHDTPYVLSNNMGPEITASMTRIGSEVRRILPFNMHCGVQILAGANKEALAVALSADLQFIRAEAYVFSQIADEGLMNSCAGELLRYRKFIGADHIKVFTDIKKKHCSHSITNDITLEETAKAAEFFSSDGVILTGKTTGDAVDYKDFRLIKENCKLPVIIGSGITANNVEKFLKADALIIGSHFKKNGLWSNEIDVDRVQKFMEVLEIIKEKKKEISF